MCKFGGLLYAIDGNSKRCLVTDADCNSWKCPECAAKNATRWTLRAELGAREFLQAGQRVDFVTITCNPKLTTWEATAEVFPHAWGKLHKRLNRQADTREYLLVIERHKTGRLHAHALWTFAVSERWLKDNAAECGLGFMASVSRLREARFATSYVSKYLGKALPESTPTHFRRVRVSKAWANVPAPVNEYSELSWQYVGGNGELNMLYRRCTDERLTMIDVRTGEIFEDVDLGTIAAV